MLCKIWMHLMLASQKKKSCKKLIPSALPPMLQDAIINAMLEKNRIGFMDYREQRRNKWLQKIFL
ncbi:hypothetical protein Ga0451573_000784 [Peptococcaceae bacterium DYL19]|nr:hypothetical protein [Phosphitispora fastidiosa]